MESGSTRRVRPEDRTAAWVLAALAIIPLGITAVALWYELPELGGTTETAGHTKEAFLFLTLPTAAGGALALVAAWFLWHGLAFGRRLAVLWLIPSIPMLGLIVVGNRDQRVGFLAAVALAGALGVAAQLWSGRRRSRRRSRWAGDATRRR